MTLDRLSVVRTSKSSMASEDDEEKSEKSVEQTAINKNPVKELEQPASAVPSADGVYGSTSLFLKRYRERKKKTASLLCLQKVVRVG